MEPRLPGALRSLKWAAGQLRGRRACVCSLSPAGCWGVRVLGQAAVPWVGGGPGLISKWKVGGMGGMPGLKAASQGAAPAQQRAHR
jgi:hypothetical protein